MGPQKRARPGSWRPVILARTSRRSATTRAGKNRQTNTLRTSRLLTKPLARRTPTPYRRPLVPSMLRAWHATASIDRSGDETDDSIHRTATPVAALLHWRSDRDNPPRRNGVG